MPDASTPRKYDDWRAKQFDREEDAAYLFGFYLVKHCRDEAIATLPNNSTPKTKAVVEKAVDTALHNVCDMLEGFWRLEAGPNHTVSLVLRIQVLDVKNEVIETADISPCKLDLPIGYQ